MSNRLLQLALGATSLDFIGDAGGKYFLLDSTFAAPPPSAEDTRSGLFSSGGERILKRRYENRQVSFSVMIKGTSVADTISSFNALYRLIERGSSDKTASGGIYGIGTTYETGSEVGEDGLVLRVQLTNTAEEDRITFRVVSGSLTVPGYFGVGGIGEMMSGKYAIERVDVVLECEPYAMGAPITLAAQGDTVYGPFDTVEDYDAAKLRYVKISASEVKGDGPAPIKFVEKANPASSGYNGMIIARESGNGILSCPSYPVAYGSGKSDFWVVGNQDLSSIKEYTVEVDGTGTPNTFKWRVGSGSWTTGVSITANAVKLGAYNVYVQFGATTGYTIGRGWTFRNDQSYIDINANNASIDLSARSGTAVTAFAVNVPYGHTGRYKVIIDQYDLSSTTEWSMATGYEISGIAGVTGSKQPWVSGGVGSVHVGVLDVTRESNSIARYPGANTSAWVTIYARRRTPSDTQRLDLEYVLLVPIEAQDSYIMFVPSSSATLIGEWRTALCGYDAKSPVIGIIGSETYDKQVFMPLSGEYLGDVPKLEPGIDQALYIIPTFGRNVISAETVPATVDIQTLEYRPRYLVVG